jgi:hypothetical protein
MPRKMDRTDLKHPSFALSSDPHAAIAVAVVEQAAHEAKKGCGRAREWIAQIQADILEVAPHLARRLGDGSEVHTVARLAPVDAEQAV